MTDPAPKRMYVPEAVFNETTQELYQVGGLIPNALQSDDSRIAEIRHDPAGVLLMLGDGSAIRMIGYPMRVFMEVVDAPVIRDEQETVAPGGQGHKKKAGVKAAKGPRAKQRAKTRNTLEERRDKRPAAAERK